jgi:hypothetical protein
MRKHQDSEASSKSSIKTSLMMSRVADPYIHLSADTGTDLASCKKNLNQDSEAQMKHFAKKILKVRVPKREQNQICENKFL